MFDKRESEEFDLTPELAALQRRLAGLTPVDPRVDRDRLMFEAGVARGEERGARSVHLAGAMPQAPQSRFWPAATALMTAATVVLSAMLAWQAKPQARDGAVDIVMAKPRAVITETDFMKPQAPWMRLASPRSGYLGVRQVALTRGVGALDSEYQSASEDGGGSLPTKPATARDILDQLVPKAKQVSPTRS